MCVAGHPPTARGRLLSCRISARTPGQREPRRERRGAAPVPRVLISQPALRGVSMQAAFGIMKCTSKQLGRRLRNPQRKLVKPIVAKFLQFPESETRVSLYYSGRPRRALEASLLRLPPYPSANNLLRILWRERLGRRNGGARRAQGSDGTSVRVQPSPTSGCLGRLRGAGLRGGLLLLRRGGSMRQLLSDKRTHGEAAPAAASCASTEKFSSL